MDATNATKYRWLVIVDVSDPERTKPFENPRKATAHEYIACYERGACERDLLIDPCMCDVIHAWRQPRIALQFEQKLFHAGRERHRAALLRPASPGHPHRTNMAWHDLPPRLQQDHILTQPRDSSARSCSGCHVWCGRPPRSVPSLFVAEGKVMSSFFWWKW